VIWRGGDGGDRGVSVGGGLSRMAEPGRISDCRLRIESRVIGTNRFRHWRPCPNARRLRRGVPLRRRRVAAVLAPAPPSTSGEARPITWGGKAGTDEACAEVATCQWCPFVPVVSYSVTSRAYMEQHPEFSRLFRFRRTRIGARSMSLPSIN
jgi:hypothetical protein